MPARTQEIASQGMGTAKTVKAAVEGPHGVFKKLTQEHGEIAALLMRAKATSDPEIRRDLFPKIRTKC